MKHKKFLTILLSLAIMVTFMPAMAFAYQGGDANYKFTDDLSQIVDSSGVYVVSTVRTWSSDGIVTVSANPNEVGNATLPTITYQYYDLTGSTFLYTGNKDIAASYNTSLAPSDIVGLKLKKPDNATAAAGVPTTATVAWSDIKTLSENKWNCKVKLNGKEETVNAAYDDTAVEITLDQEWTAANNARVTGAPAAATTKVNAKAAVASDAEFYFDTVPATGTTGKLTPGATATVPYDGAEHTIVMKPLKGYDVTYTTFNKTTGKQDAVDGNKVVLKDVLKDNLEVHAKVADTATGKKTAEFVFKLNVESANAPYFAWESTDNISYDVADNAEYDPYDYVAVKESTDGASDAKKTADKAAAAANADLLKEFFKTYYGVTATEAAQNAGNKYSTVKLTVGKYSVKKATDVDAKFATMLKNFGFTDATVVSRGFTVPTTTPRLTIVPADKYVEVEFTNSPTSKTYKGSKTTKKGKLKKNYSFTVKAEATNGDAVSYKLINAPEKITIDKSTGKITLKKGLAKGTYKIKVKAYVPKSYDWVSESYQPSETHSITIKVKK